MGKNVKTFNLKPFKRVIILGVDGLDPIVLKGIFARGGCPNLRRIADSGYFEKLGTSNPPQSPVAWATMATGTNPGRHGIFDFISRDPSRYLPELAIIKPNRANFIGNRDKMFLPVRKGRAFWEVISEAGIPCTVLRWPMNFPPQGGRGSRVLSGLGVPDIKGGLGRYTFYTTIKGKEIQEEKGEIVYLNVAGDRIDTFINGPEILGIMGRKESRVPISIRVKNDDEISIHLNEDSIILKKGRWSDWIPINFPSGLGRSIRGMVKFYLIEARPEMRLYLSPIQVDPTEPCFPVSMPDSYCQELSKKIGRFHTLGLPEDTKALTEGCLDEEAFISMCDQIMNDQERIFEMELDRLNEGLLAAVFFTTDRIHHIFWASQDPSCSIYGGEYYKKYRWIIPDYYERIDKIVGLVNENFDENTLLIIPSDHGFAPFRRGVHLNSWLYKNGYMSLKEEIDPEDKEGGPLFRYVDWSRTRAYCVGFNGIYLNLMGREENGIVTDKEAQSIKERIRRELLDLIDPRTGNNPILRIFSREEIYSGEYIHFAPDLIVGYRKGYRASWQTAIGGTPPSIFEDNIKKWTGDHIMDPSEVPGIIVSNKRLLSKSPPTILDIAPTVLSSFGLLPLPQMEGKSLIGLEPNL
jgi:predicted AlkP superfamily phosphohydrolase/phosphomutase